MSPRVIRALKVALISTAAIAFIVILAFTPGPGLFSKQEWPLHRFGNRNSVLLGLEPKWIADLQSSLMVTQTFLNKSLYESEHCEKQKLHLQHVISELNSTLTVTLIMLNHYSPNCSTCNSENRHLKSGCSNVSDAANMSMSSLLATTQATKSIPFIDLPLSCDWIEDSGGSHSANFGALLHLCSVPAYRPQLHAWVIPEFRDRLIRLSNGTGILEEAFVSFISGPISYLDLAQWAIAAALEFSSKPVILFVSGDAVASVAGRFPSLTFQRLVVFEVPPPRLHPWFDKLRAVLLSPVVNGVIIESDTIITPHAERLFNVAKTHATEYSLSPVHEDERLPSCYNYQGPRACINPYDYPAYLRTIPYIHAHMIWNSRSKPFVSRVLSTCVETPGESDCSSDEGALNHQLWKEKATRYLCLIDPHTSVLEMWDAQTMSHPGLQMQNFAVMYLHGAKDPARAELVFNRIKGIMMRNLPWVWYNRRWSNDTDDNLSRALLEASGCLF